MFCTRPSTLHDWRRPANSPSGYSLARAGWDGLRTKCLTGSSNDWTAAKRLADTPAEGAGGRDCKPGHPTGRCDDSIALPSQLLDVFWWVPKTAISRTRLAASAIHQSANHCYRDERKRFGRYRRPIFLEAASLESECRDSGTVARFHRYKLVEYDDADHR